MLILGIESATTTVGAAIVERDRSGADTVRAHRSASAPPVGTGALHPMIVDALRDAGVTIDAIDSIAVDVGPGLFTGLRVGVATAKALAFALDLPIVGCRSTEVLLRGVRPGRGVAVLDMRRGEVAYATDRNPAVAQLVDPSTCAARLDEDDHIDGSVLRGDGVARYAEAFAALIERRGLVLEPPSTPDAVGVAALGLDAIERGDAIDVAIIEPEYLRAPDAVANFRSRGDGGSP